MLQQVLQAETLNKFGHDHKPGHSHKSGHGHLLLSPVPDTTSAPVPESDLMTIDYILGSDCLYTTEDFEAVISLVAAIMTDSRDWKKSRGERNTVFYTTYYQRRYVYRVLCIFICLVSNIIVH